MKKSLIDDLQSYIRGIVQRKGTGKALKIPAGTYPGQVINISLGRCGMNAKEPGAVRIKIVMWLFFGEKRGAKVTAYYKEPLMSEILDTLSQGFGMTTEEKIEAANKIYAIWQVYYNPDVYKSIQIGGRIDGGV